MAKNQQEDYFESTSMSFGEHLEELRSCLVKALAGLMVGFLVGLFLANYVVRFIEMPLTKALEQYYIDKDVEELREQFGDEMQPAVEQFMRRQRFRYEVVYFEAREIERLMANLPSETAADDGDTPSGRVTAASFDQPLPPPDENLVKTRIWRPAKSRITALSAQEAFMIWLKAGFITGLILASPYMFWQIWTCVAAGLYPHEQRYVYIDLPFSLALFLAGAALAFFFVFEPVLSFLFSFNKGMNIDPDPRISEWISFVLFLPLGFGIAFQLPLIMLFVNRIGIFSVESYLSKWRVAILVIFVLSMLLTPADPISMLLMAAPLTLLYFLGIGLCVWMPKGKNPFSEGYDPT